MKDLQKIGGNYTTIASDGDRIFVAGFCMESSGWKPRIYVSTDAGKNWKGTSIRSDNAFKSIIIQDSTVFTFADNAPYIYYTTDNGENWNIWEMNSMPYYYPGSGDIRALEIIDNNWFVGLYIPIQGPNDVSGILISHDNGKNFILKQISTGNKVLINNIKGRENNIIAATTDGLYVSKDNGDTWQKIGLEGLDVRSIAINDNIILAGVLNNGIYYSSDYGASWEKVGLDGLSPTVVIKGDYAYAGTEQGVYISSNKGYSWEQTSLKKISVPSITIEGENIYAATSSDLSAGILLSKDNGLNWQKIGIKRGIPIKTVANKDNTIFACGNIIELQKSIDNGETWQNCSLTRNISGGIATIVFDKGNIFAGANYGLFISTDDGNTWKNTSDIYSPNGIGSIAIKGDSIFVGRPFGYGGVLLSTDFGKTWEDVFLPIYVFALGVKGDSVLMGKWNGLFLLTSEMQRWDSGGEGNWKRLIQDPKIKCIKTDNESIFAAGDSGFYKIPSNTGIYEKIGPMKNAQAIALEGKKIVVGSNDEVYLSRDYGKTWEITGLSDPYRTPLSPPYVNSLAINADTIFAATESGLYRYIIGDTSTVQDTVIDDSISLVRQEQAENPKTGQKFLIFPNPARDYIYINSPFINGARGVWQYQIYDILGNCVQSGTIESDKININQLSTGFYTVRFFNGGKQVIEKLMKE